MIFFVVFSFLLGNNLTTPAFLRFSKEMIQEKWEEVSQIPNTMNIWTLIETKDGEIYASTTSEDFTGKVYKSNDKCLSWGKTGDFPVEVDDAISIYEDKDENLYVGTYCTEGARIFRSTDKGNTWVQVFESSQDAWVYPIIQTQKGRFLAETGNSQGKIYESLDGINWSLNNKFSALEGIFFIFQSKDGTLYTGGGTEELRETLWVYKSLDEGETWEKTGGIDSALSLFSMTEDKEGTLFLSTLCWRVEDGEMVIIGKVFKSLDKGETWIKIKEILDYVPWSIISVYPDSIFVGCSSMEGYGPSIVLKYDIKNDGWDEDTLLVEYIYSLLQSSEYDVYAGTGEEGRVFKYKRKLGIEEEEPLFFDVNIAYKNTSSILLSLILPQDGFLSIKVYDVAGQLMKRVPFKFVKRGKCSFTFMLPEGVYFIYINVNDREVTRKVVIF